MRNLTINLGNYGNTDRNILIYQKGPEEGYMRISQLVWRKIIAPHNSLTPFGWEEAYSICIARKRGNNRFDTVSSREIRPGEQIAVMSDYRSSELVFGEVRQTGRGNVYTITTDGSIPYGLSDYCIGLGIGNKLCYGVEQIMPAMNYVFRPLPEYYILASDKFNEGDLLTGEIEEMARKLEFPASGKLDLQLHNDNSWVIKPA